MQVIPFVWVVLYGWHLLFNIKDLISPFSPSIRLLNSLNPDIALTYAISFICQHETLGSFFQRIHIDELIIKLFTFRLCLRERSIALLLFVNFYCHL